MASSTTNRYTTPAIASSREYPEVAGGRHPLRIGIDISRTTGQRTGVGSYASRLVEGLAAVDGETIARKILRDDLYAPARAALPAQLGAALAQFEGERSELFIVSKVRCAHGASAPAAAAVSRARPRQRTRLLAGVRLPAPGAPSV